LEEIVISPLAKGDAHTNHILYTHSSNLLTTEELFGLGCLDNSCGANDLSDLFKPGTIPAAVPEPSTRAMMLLGFVGLGLALGNHDAVLRSSEASIVCDWKRLPLRGLLSRRHSPLRAFCGCAAPSACDRPGRSNPDRSPKANLKPSIGMYEIGVG
jgi:hypothetical protein